ncbi:type I-E CRISPR-associated protein Cas7/Cse4/CasC [Nocardia aurantia]|uniref:CRISPR system Cascade subunit CasC n=1 Tax=Nocardia aurantia TaxID=2585199 RepID=A0A7K0DSZ6_9NOCA|nr:type I-E CRISPR-associated protein Cas7/Cse4/CasC [Nocardia aurantia]MQY28893.1 CRISPR system Cascade subunit CasC [Nocardia aurantia]
MTKRAYVDVHILQTVPPANLNRDDQGNPKEAVYGGVRRSRVSSQAWKRATRMHFVDRVPEQDRATRTRKVAGELAKRLKVRTEVDQEQTERIATALLAPVGITAGKKAGATAYLLFVGNGQLDAVIDLVADDAQELAGLDDAALAEAVKQLPVAAQFRENHPLDVALFGRMVADIPALNVDAAVQVAHALSTHATEAEFDYFTAVDDANEDHDPGAGMIGTIGFNSATLYRYASVGLKSLHDNLGETDAALDAVDVFVESFARSMPTGHGNAFAHRTLPSLVAITVREDQPVNLVSAFEKPIPPRQGGIAELSAQRLAEEQLSSVRLWGDAPAYTAHAHAFAPDTASDKLAEAFGAAVTFGELREGLREQLAGYFTR